MTTLPATAPTWWWGEPLTPGTRVAFSGAFSAPRPVVVARARAAGLAVDDVAGPGTALLVANDAGSGSDAVRWAITAGVPIVDEYAFDALIGV
ncbi:hypothetical protein [Kineococcus sp. SYSU DK004]|uniref:hypothetical protein n=1 Tax=Kineococcus sp. SYSU DK004 TaxID=3383125 RepID=UPI003D7D0A17